MPFPDELCPPISTTAAEWLLAYFGDQTVPPEVESYLSHLRGDVREARAQDSMFR